MPTDRFRRAFIPGLLALSALLASCASAPSAPPAATATERPRLVVVFVVDGLPQRQVTGYRDQLAPDGFARFLDRGAWFANAHYGHAFTVTGAGHATILTGAYPHRTGIIGNDWRDVQTGAPVYNTGDPTATYLTHRTQPLDGTSPRNLRAETVGDVLRRVDPRAHVLAVSGKDRGAILTAGHRGVAWMYMASSGGFDTSTYYLRQQPAWVQAFNARKPADRYFRTEWKALLPEAAYARSVPDDTPWYGPRGGRLPMMMGAPADAAPGPMFYGSLLASPFADALTLEFAQAAIEGEGLGRDQVPDLLAISLSGHDYVNHRWSAESRLSHDHLLQLDRLLQGFFRTLDARVGAGNYVAVLTADHGFMPTPEYARTQGLDGGRIAGGALLARINDELEKAFGVPRLASFSTSAVLFDRTLVARHRLSLDALAEATRRVLLAEPFIAAAYTRRELESGSRAGAPHFDAIRRSWHAEVSADVQYAVKPYWMFGSGSAGGAIATHGSPHPYDTHVPLMVWGPRWVQPGRIDGRVEIVDLAPTLAAMLQVPAPASSAGRRLPLPMP